MEEWREYKLSELMDVLGGGTPKTTIPDYWNGDIPWLSVVDFGNDSKKVYTAEKSITLKGLNNSSTKVLKKGQLIISARGTVGELAILGRDMAFNQSCYGLNAKEGICTNEFLYYLLKLKVPELRRNAYGAVFDTITRSSFDTISTLIPPLPTQTAIAEILSSLDDKIELNNAINKNLEDLAQALFKRWFVDFEFPNEDGLPYQSSGGEMVESELGMIPKGWRISIMSDVSKITIGRTPPRKEHQWFSENNQDCKWISIKDMGNSGVYIFQTSEYLTREAVNKFNVPIIKKNTVILSFKLTVGRVAITTEDMLSNEAIAHININGKEPLSPEFLYLFFKQFNFDSLGSTSSIATAVNSKSINSIPLVIPDWEIFGRFQNIIYDIFQELFNLALENHKLQELRDYLLPKLISGELEVEQAISETEKAL